MFMLIGYLAFGLGFIGIFLPILPTTPFMIVALWAFSKGNKKMHSWLLNHPKFGNSLQQWESHQIIPLKAKLTALGFISLSAGYLILFSEISIYIRIIAVISMAYVIIYVLTRPSKL